MDDLISRTEALEAIDEMKPMQNNTDQLIMNALCWAAVKSIPVTVDAAPVVHGRWEVCDDCGITRCSACKWNFESHIEYKYCPNCGAKMINEE